MTCDSTPCTPKDWLPTAIDWWWMAATPERHRVLGCRHRESYL